MANRAAALVNTPSPERLIFMATALAPKRAHRNEVNVAATKERLSFLGKRSVMLLNPYPDLSQESSVLAGEAPREFPTCRRPLSRGPRFTGSMIQPADP